MKSLYFPLFLACSALLPAQTTAHFNTNDPADGPFPSDAFATADPSQKTGEHVNVPSGQLAPLLNQLDGFSVNPRITICFSGRIDPATTASGISIYPVQKKAQPIAFNQIIYDQDGSPSQSPVPALANCVYGKPDQPLAESSQYLVVATNAIQDASGKKIKIAAGYDDCSSSNPAYCASLAAALKQVKPSGPIVTASLFTTMSATAWLESAKKFVDSSELPIVLPAGLPYEFSLSNLSSITWQPDLGGGATAPQDVPLSALTNVDKVAFGLYLSPNFLNMTGPAAGTITQQPTNKPVTAPVPAPTPIPGISFGYLPISFHVFLPPQNLVPGAHIPVVIYGHGMGDSQFGAPTYIANTLAKNGFATLAMEIPGHGFGPLSTVKVQSQQNLNFTMLTPGRGAPSGRPIGPTDGCTPALNSPVTTVAVAVRDCARQAAVDLIALVRTIKLTNGLGLNLDSDQIFYVGQSFGSTYGPIFNAVEPEVRAAVINSGGGTSVDIARLAISGRPLAELYLAAISPALFNVPPAPQEPYFHFPDPFNDNYVFRNLAPVTNKVQGAIPIQNALEWADWLGMSGDPLGYAGLLNSSGKPVLVQFSYGDLEVPNPTESAFVRAAGLQGSTWYLHFECASVPPPELALFPECPASATPQPVLLGITMPQVAPLPILPHRMLSNPTIFSPDASQCAKTPTAGNCPEQALALALQNQVAGFFSSNGQSIPDPNSFLKQEIFNDPTLFERSPTLPEMLNFIQIQP